MARDERNSAKFRSPRFSGMKLRDLLPLMWEARGELRVAHWPQTLKSLVQSLLVEVISAEEERQLSAEHGEPPEPIVVLGCMRGGTTHLQYLLSQDRRLAAPTTLQVLFPHIFFFLEHKLAGRRIRLYTRLYNAWRRRFYSPLAQSWAVRGFDNLHGGLHYPSDDCIAMKMMKQDDDIGRTLPSLAERYHGYLTLRHLDAPQIERWKLHWTSFLRKLTLRYPGKALLLKSGSHTGKIRFILDLFPNAKFIHISRDPYALFRSFRHYRQYTMDAPEVYLESFIKHYSALYSAYLLDRDLIPDRNLHELSYEDLVSSPLMEIEKAYAALSLPAFSVCRGAMERYIGQVEGYRRTAHPLLTRGERKTLNHHLGSYFEALGYSPDD